MIFTGYKTENLSISDGFSFDFVFTSAEHACVNNEIIFHGTPTRTGTVQVRDRMTLRHFYRVISDFKGDNSARMSWYQRSQQEVLLLPRPSLLQQFFGINIVQ